MIETYSLRILVDPNGDSGLQADIDSGNIRTLILVYTDSLSAHASIIC
jgi:hypothetical protein